MKKVLIDSHILLWTLSEPEKLKKVHSEILKDTSVTILVSTASLWELYIKVSLKKLTLPNNFIEEIEKNFITILPIKNQHLTLLLELPYHHNDPFDRLIITQSIAENLPVISYDKSFHKYQVELM